MVTAFEPTRPDHPTQGWEHKDGTLQAKAVMFPWQDEGLRGLFEQVCEAGVKRVQELFEGLKKK